MLNRNQNGGEGAPTDWIRAGVDVFYWDLGGGCWDAYMGTMSPVFTFTIYIYLYLNF